MPCHPGRACVVLLVIILVAALTGGCGGGGREAAAPVPGWLNSPPSAPGMLYGVGQVSQANQRDQAIAAARVDLAGQIEISINAIRQQEDRVAETMETGKSLIGRVDSASQSTVQARIAVEALPGLKTDQIYEGENRTAALVSLDRQQWAQALRLHLAELDAFLSARRDEIVANASKDMSVFAITIRTYRTLLPSLRERDELARRLRIASPGAAVPPAPVSAVALRTALSLQLGVLRIALVGKDASATGIIPTIYERCTAVGLKVVAQNAPSDLLLTLAVQTTTADIQGDIRADGRLDGTLSQSQGDRQLAGFSVKGRASSTKVDTARDRLHARLAEELIAEFDAHLLEWLEGY